jgi:hypothetical protein
VRAPPPLFTFHSHTHAHIRSHSLPPAPTYPRTRPSILSASSPSSRSIEKVDEKAVTLADSAQKFKTAGTALKRKMRCRYYKIIVFFGFLFAAIIAAIIAYYVQKNKDEQQPPAQ